MMNKSWNVMLERLADNCRTTDSIIEERMKPLSEVEVEKAKADRSFINLWVAFDPEEEEPEYTVRDCELTYSYADQIRVVFSSQRSDGKREYPLQPERFFDVGEDDESPLHHLFYSKNSWMMFCTDCRLINKQTGVGFFLDDLQTSPDEGNVGLDYAQDVLTKMFKIMKDYNPEKLNSFILENNISVDRATGKMLIPGDALGL